MQYLLIIMFTLTLFPCYAFDRSKNILLYDEAITPRQTVFMAQFAVQCGGGASGGSNGGGGSALAADAQPTYSKPTQFGDQAEIIAPYWEGCSLKWVGDNETGYIVANTYTNETLKIHPPTNAEYSSWDFQSGWAWDVEDGTRYEICVFRDGFIGVYQRPPDNPGGFWAYESHIENTYADIPDAVKGYIQVIE